MSYDEKPLWERLRDAARAQVELTELRYPEQALRVNHTWSALALREEAALLEREAAAEAGRKHLVAEIARTIGYHENDIPGAARDLLERFDITPKEKP